MWFCSSCSPLTTWPPEVCIREDHYPAYRLDIYQDSEFATGYGYPKTAFERQLDTDKDIRYAFLDISSIQTFGKSCTLHNHSFSLLPSATSFQRSVPWLRVCVWQWCTRNGVQEWTPTIAWNKKISLGGNHESNKELWFAGKTAVLPVMTKRFYIFVQMEEGKSPKVAQYFCTSMTISYLLTTCRTARQIYRICRLLCEQH